MKTYPVRIGDKGRFVVPQELREAAGWDEGQELVAWLDADGNLRLGKPTDDEVVRMTLASLTGEQRRAVEGRLRKGRG